MPSKQHILVTSAAGRVGRHAVQLLLSRGHKVRAFVRTRDARAAELERLGAEVFAGNLFDFSHLQKAMVGVEQVFHIPPFAPHLLHQTMLVCLAAQAAQVDNMVLLSGWNPSPAHPSLLTREHWIANNIARWMPDVGVIHLNPGIFAFTYLLTLPVTRQLGVLPLPFGNGRNAPVSERDIARSGVALLENPHKYHGTSWRPTGPQLLSGEQAATIIGKVLRRPVRYQPISFRMFSKAARAMGFSDFDSYNLRHYADEVSHDAFAIGAPTDHVEELTGEPAESFEETVRHYANDVSRLAPNVRETNRIGAVSFMMRMLLTPAPDFSFERGFDGATTLSSPLAGHENPEWQFNARAQQIMLLEGADFSPVHRARPRVVASDQ